MLSGYLSVVDSRNEEISLTPSQNQPFTATPVPTQILYEGTLPLRLDVWKKGLFHLEVLSFETFFWPFLNPSPACPPRNLTWFFSARVYRVLVKVTILSGPTSRSTSEICDVFYLKNPDISLNWMKNHGFVESLYRNYLKQVNQAAFKPSTEPQTQTFFLGTHTASVANPEK